MDTVTKYDQAFADDVKEGLSASPKYLSSKYFYDDKGSELFQQIMRMPAYYPTDLEYEIFQTHKQTILDHFAENTEAFQLMEFGAGDGLKTKILLAHFLSQQVQFSYTPIDISASAVHQLEADLKGKWPDLQLDPFIGDYFAALRAFTQKSNKRKAVLFLGSNIGNFREGAAINFLKGLAADLLPGDKVLIGFDLKKDPEVILNAYNDAAGITKEFNLNLLRRINRELGGNFDTTKFIHSPIYNPMTGATESFLVSTEAQEVRIEELDLDLKFVPWEAIWMELSQKYDYATIENFAYESGFEVETHLTDAKGWYVDSIWRKV